MIEDGHRLIDGGVRGAGSISMTVKSSVEVVRVTHVEGAVAAIEDVDVPLHGQSPSTRSRCSFAQGIRRVRFNLLWPGMSK